MRVVIERDGFECETLGVYLDNGKEVGRYCIVNDPEAERRELEAMIHACVQEYTSTLNPENGGSVG